MARVRDLSDPLPPAGDDRREVLAEREDRLQAEAEQRAAALEIERIDPKALRPEREILQHFDEFNELAVSNAQDDHEYCWVYAGRNSYWVRWKSAQGFEVVQGDMPESQEHRGIGADSTRRVGDTILMRIRKDRAVAMRRRGREQAARREESIDSTIMALGEQYRDTGVRVSRLGGLSPAQQDLIAKRAHARQIATSQFTDQIRQGTVPGLRPGGR
jgi:hypothetical protein